MAVERAVVQDHVGSPTHAVENRTPPRDRAYGKACAEGLSEGAEIRMDTVVLLAASGRVTKAGDNFVEDEQHIILLCQLTYALQVPIPRRNAAHIGHDGLGDYRREFVSMLLHDSF